MQLTICDKTGKVKKTVSPDTSSQWAHEVCVENTVTVNFTTWEFVVFSVGDYISIDGHRFKIKKEYRPKQANKQKYTYNLKFYGREHDAEDLLFCRLNQGEDDLESVFAYDGTPTDFLRKVVQNLNRNTDGVVWKVGEAVNASRRAINFNGLYCWDALNEIAGTFETEWWADGEYLNLCKCERGERVTLGYLQGLKTGLTQQENTNAIKWFTRLIPVGSTKNIDPLKYGYAHLQLPSRAKFIDLNTQLGLKEHREETAFAEIFPHRTGTISAVRSELKTNEDTGEYTVYYVSDKDLPFNPDDYMLPGLVIHISFNSGTLSGKDFECNWHNDTREFEIINTYPDKNTQLPGGNLIPATGNTYILWNIRMPDSYLTTAERDYEAAVNNFLSEYAKDVSIYSADTDYIYADSNSVPLLPGQRVKLLSGEYFSDTGGYRDSRMTRVVRKLNNLNEATVECSDAVNTSWKSSVDSSLNGMKYTIAEQLKQGLTNILKTGDPDSPSDYNVFSARRALREITGYALSRSNDDTARGLITFLKGLISGGFAQFNSGLIVRSPLTNRELKSVVSDALTEAGNGNDEIMFSALREEGNGNEGIMSLSLTETGGGGDFGGTIGEVDNMDEAFDTCADGTYILQKRNGIYYPVKGSAGAGSKMTLSSVSSATPVFVYGSDAIITFRFSSVLNDEETGPGSVTYTVNNRPVASADIAQGEISFNAKDYLVSGDNTLVVTVTDSYNATRKLVYKINAASISLTSTFDETQPYTGVITFTYLPVGAVEKVVHFILDGKETGTATTSISNRQQTYSIPAQAHGAHTLEVYMTATIDKTVLESEHLFYSIISVVPGNSTPVIASPFRQTTAEQFGTIVIPYLVYSPNSSSSEITLWANNSVVSQRTVGRSMQSWSYRASDTGNLVLKIACGSVSRTFTLTVAESEVTVRPEEADLALFLTSVNRSNNEEEEGRAMWNYGEIYAILTAFNFATNGWIKTVEGFTALRVSGDARVTIPYFAFANDFRATGKTLEFEFETRDVMNYDAVVLSCMNDGVGLEVTAQKAVFKSQQSTVETSFKEDERVRIAFSVEKKAENRLIYVFVNGEMCGVVQYPAQDNFTQKTPAGITIGNDNCTTDTFNIRVYDNNLNRYQLLDNYIADMDDLETKRALFARNRIYDDYGNISYERIADRVPVLTIIGRLPSYKGDKVTCAMRYEDRRNTDKSWYCPKVRNNVQGTSSQYYPRKNYKFNFLDSLEYTASGKKSGTFALRNDSIPVSCFCVKADFAESSGVHNTGMARMIDFMQRGMNLLTAPQTTDARVRTTVDGYPICIFHRETEDSEPVFLGKYNFNNDKSTQETFGFTPGCESWEIRNNTSDRVLFKVSDYTSDDWQKDFEARYPDGNTDCTNLKRLTDWLVSVQDNPDKFKEGAPQYLDIRFILFYYVVTEFFAMVDQRAKNMFLTTYDGTHWIPIFYDNDTVCGINNEGLLAFDFNVEYHDKSGSQDVFNGEQSTLWNNIEQAYAAEIADLYAEMRKNNVLSYEQCIRFLETEQGDKWSEAIYNEDGFYKYVRPLLDEGNGSYLYACQGSRKAHRLWWLYNRFRYMDSKYIAGDYMNNFATMRIYTPVSWQGVKPNANITITPYAGQYVNIKYGSYLVGARTEKDRETAIQAPDIIFNDTETIIYGADMISSLGDLSALYAGTVDVSKMTKLSELIAGSGATGYRNTNLTVLSVGANALLRKLDIRNCPNLTQSLDLSRCPNIREVYAEGTGITAVSLPDGGSLSLLHLPGTVTNLTVRNQPQLTTDGFALASVENLNTIRWENTNGVNILSTIGLCFALDDLKLERIRVTGADWFVSNLDLIVKLCTLKGLDEHGNNTEHAVVTGKCYVSVANEAYLAKIREAFPELVVTYGQLKPATTTTFVFRSSQNKALTNVSFICNMDFERVNDYTYKVIAEDGMKIETTFKCDNHQDCANTYLVAGTRTQTYSAVYIPLRTIRVRVYNQSVYVPGAEVVINGKTLISDADGYVSYRGGEAVTGTVSAYGYGSNTFSFSAISGDVSHTVDVYSTVEVKFIIKFGSTLIEGATVKAGIEKGVTNMYGECVLTLVRGNYDYTVTHPDYITKTGNISVGTSATSYNISVEPTKVDLKFIVRDQMGSVIDNATITVDGLIGVTDSDGTYTLRVNSKQAHNYMITKFGYYDYSGNVSVATSTVTQYITMPINIEVLKPVANNNIQLLLKGTDVTLNISSTTSDYVIDWGDGISDNASGIDTKTYNHTYATSGLYQVEVKNCINITECNGTSACLIAYWEIGNSKIANLSFKWFSKLMYIGNVFQNDTIRTSFDHCFNYCYELTTIYQSLFENCVAATSFIYCFGSCRKLISIPQGLFKGCLNAINFYYCFYECFELTVLPPELFENCIAATNFYGCFRSCRKLRSIPQGLFKDCSNATTFDQCFDTCYQLTTIPQELFENCTKATSFNSCFNSCTQLTAIPKKLFKNCINASIFNACFGSCSKLVCIPEDLFKNCINASNFRWCFRLCGNLTTIPQGLFRNCTEATTFELCFCDCSQLTTIPQGLFDSCTKAANFRSCFSSCSQLTTIPQNLFDNCNNITDISYCFAACSKIISALPALWIQYYGKTITKTDCYKDCASAANWLEVPVSWGGTASEYVPVQVSGVMMADYRALEARIRNLEQQNTNKN